MSTEIPTGVLAIVESELAKLPIVPIAIVPSGSLLYNTEIPGRARHDWDFVIFAEPCAYLEKYRHFMVGDVDFFIIAIDKIFFYKRQVQFTEAYFALKMKTEVVRYKDWALSLNEEVELLANFWECLTEAVRKHAAKEYVPARLEHEFKHQLRWQCYLARVDKESFTPILTNAEREWWLAKLSDTYLA
mgnify:CR=1 FL=1|jgi:hypothetical protein